MSFDTDRHVHERPLDLQPLVETAEATLQLDEAKRRRTIIRLDAGAGTEDDLNCLLERGYEIMVKEYSGRRIARLSKTVNEWVQDPIGRSAPLAG